MIDLYKKCNLCPRNCLIDRTKTLGYCKATDKVKVARSALHYFEEPSISGTNGSGTIFFSNCNLKCCYCQNKEISTDGFGKEVSIERLSEMMLELEEKHANNINLVTPTHYVPSIIEAIKLARSKGLSIPIVYNTSGYESVETLKLLDGYIDIYLTDFKYFDDKFADSEYRVRIIKMFPKEIQKAYIDYKNGTLPQDFNGDARGWVLLDPTLTVKFNIDDSDVPLFVSVVPHLMDLEDAQEIDKKKMAQQILKIIVQKFPLDKNMDLVFDLDEMNAFHRMAVNMIGDAVGVDVLSTLADVDVLDMADNNNVSSVDQLDKVERTVYNESGTSQALFNSEGSVALEKSVLNDEASILDLIYQFEEFAENLIAPLNKNIKKKLIYRVNMLPTTVYNYKDLSEKYREQTMLGFSKLLPAVALGIPQTVVIANAIFENQMLKLDEVFIPPQMSSTMSADQEKKAEENQDNKQSSAADVIEPADKGGRPDLKTEEKSEKTVRNIEAEQ